MITDQKTIDALKELNYSQVYEKGKEDAIQEILDKIRLEFHTFREEFIESKLEIEDFDIGNLLYNIEKQLNQPKTEHEHENQHI